MNFHTDIVNVRGAYWRGVLILKVLLFGGVPTREWALIRSFTVVQNDDSVYNIILVSN